MSDLAKKARAAMKSKAERLGKTTTQKVDSSTWTPAEELNADVKTGLRPISRRAYKKGGKVMGEACEARADRKPRKNGGKAEYKAEASEFAKAKINRNVKDANEEREGKKHIGGMKSGGRAEKLSGGALARYAKKASRKGDMAARMSKDDQSGEMARYANKRQAGVQMALAKMQDKFADSDKDQGTYKKGGRAGKNEGGMSSGRGILTKGGKDVVGPTSMPATEEKKAPPIPQRPQREPEKGMSGAEASEFMKARKSGGRAKKAGGGDLEMYGKGVSGAAEMMKKAGARAGVPGGLYGSGFTRVGAGKLSPAGAAIPMARMKKGGEAKHPDEKMDIALIKKMVKPEARKAKKEGGFLRTLADRVVGDLASDEAKKLKDKIMEGIGGNMKKGGRAARKEGGGVFSGPGYPGKIPGVVPGGREARATGGKTKGKGKTNINIIIAAGKPASAEDMMAPGMGGPTPPPGLGGAPGGVPVPVPAAGGAPGAAPMPMPIPMPMPAAGGAGPMPTPRKDGGRLTKVASSFKDMQAGAGSGEGRLQKTDIAKARMGRRAGGKTYRSYKDMDAGAGSGVGRLEKTEIQKRK